MKQRWALTLFGQLLIRMSQLFLKLIAPGTHIVGVGSFQASMVEIPPFLFKTASIFVDQIEACWSEAGEVIAARARGHINSEDVLELGEVELGNHPGRRSNQVTIFKSVGIAIQDAVASSIAVNAAKTRELARR